MDKYDINKEGVPAVDKSKQTKVNYFIVSVFALVVGVIAGANLTKIAPFIGSKQADELDFAALQRVYSELKEKYDGEIKTEDLVEGSIKGLVYGLGDPHSSYMTKEESKRFQESLTGDIGGGIGAEIGLRDGNITIIRPLKNNPAIKAGVEAGDVVVKVDDEDVTGQDVETVVLKIRGAPDSSVKLTLYREGEPDHIDVNVVRAIVDNPSVELSYDNNIAIITLYRFDEKTVGLMKKAAHDLKLNGSKGVILDLRDNTGGLLTAAQGVAGLWVDGQVVLTQKHFGQIVDTVYAPAGQAELGSMPTTVLINENSASASEILAAALRDYNKAKLLGVKTYGKGSVQELMGLPTGGQLKLTIAHWFTSTNKTIEKEGIEPDIKVERSAEEIKSGVDPQLTRALELMR